MKSAQSKIRETQKENDELMKQLAKKERECEAKVQEMEELMQVRLRSWVDAVKNANAKCQLDLLINTQKLYSKLVVF